MFCSIPNNVCALSNILNKKKRRVVLTMLNGYPKPETYFLTMKLILQFFTLRRSFIFSACILAILVLFNFYGPYTNKFYFFKIGNYLLPLLTLVHFTYIYVLWFKIKEEEMTDLPMRNLEYMLYVVVVIYLYKAFESIYILSTYGDYNNHILPSVFLPIGILILVLYLLLIGLTLLLFKYRKERVGAYDFDDMDHIDSWE